MRPDDRPAAFHDHTESGMDLPFDADLESVHGELAAAGRHARRMLYGRTQPTRLFSNQLRAHLLGGASNPAAASRPASTTAVGAGSTVRAGAAPRATAADPGGAVGGRADATDERAPGPHEHREGWTVPALTPPALTPRSILALLAIVSMAGVLALGALSGTFGPPLP